MMLISAEGAEMGWNAVGCFPRRNARDGSSGDTTALLIAFPPGDYYVFRRFVDQTVWGGVEISLRAGQRTRLGIGTDEAAAWTVEVVDAEGRPVTGQLLRIRNRLYEASLAYLDPGTRNASSRDPDPPFRRLRGRPVTFESIRPGLAGIDCRRSGGPTIRRALRGTISAGWKPARHCVWSPARSGVRSPASV